MALNDKREEAKRLYVRQSLTCPAIAGQLEVAPGTVYRWKADAAGKGEALDWDTQRRVYNMSPKELKIDTGGQYLGVAIYLIKAINVWFAEHELRAKSRRILMSKIALLRPEVRAFFEDFISKLEKEGFCYSVLETLRTLEVQEAYYAQGRRSLEEINELRKKAGLYILGAEEGKRIVTKTMESVHLTGRAADIVPVVDGKIPWSFTAENAELWKTFGRLGQEAGLEWGGAWTPLNSFGIGWDAPHYQRLGTA